MSLVLQDFFVFKEYSLRKAKEGDIKRLVNIINDAFAYQNETRGELRTSYGHLKNLKCPSEVALPLLSS